MLFNVRIGVALLGAAMLAGCNTVTEGQWNTAQAVIQGSPAVKRDVIKGCLAHQAAKPLAERKLESEVLNVRLERVPSVYCNRLWNAFAKGRITYADYLKLWSSTADNSKVIKIMQGQ
jgi:hypothetical protein